MNKQVKPEEIQTIPAFNYYASKEELSNTINNINVSITNAIRENNKELKEDWKREIEEFNKRTEVIDARLEHSIKEWRQENKELRNEARLDFRWSIGTMIGGFIVIVATMVGLYLKH